MFGLFEFLAMIITIFVLIVYIIYTDIKSNVQNVLNEGDDDEEDDPAEKKCKLKCVKPTKKYGNCYHPVKYNPVLKKDQEIRSQLICPWQCSSGYSDDPDMCQYDNDCTGCSPDVSFNSIDERCPSSTYGCCGNVKNIINRTDEFGNNCLGLTGADSSLEPFTSQIIQDEKNMPLQIYPACPDISCPNSNAFKEDTVIGNTDMKTFVTESPWDIITKYN